MVSSNKFVARICLYLLPALIVNSKCPGTKKILKSYSEYSLSEFETTRYQLSSLKNEFNVDRLGERLKPGALLVLSVFDS